MSKDIDYVTEFLSEWCPNGVDKYGDRIEDDDDDLGADEIVAPTVPSTIVIRNTRAFPVHASVAVYTPGEKRNWKTISGQRVDAGSKAAFTIPAGTYKVKVIHVLRSERVVVKPNEKIIVQIGSRRAGGGRGR